MALFEEVIAAKRLPRQPGNERVSDYEAYLQRQDDSQTRQQNSLNLMNIVLRVGLPSVLLIAIGHEIAIYMNVEVSEQFAAAFAALKE